MTDELPDTTQVVYVSPLKALSNDIRKNLAAPLEEIAALASEKGRLPAGNPRWAAHRGHDRRRSARRWRRSRRTFSSPPRIAVHPAHLGQRAARTEGVNTLILDEIHAVADDKRGSHLSLSVERLCALSEQPVVRIGLSATQRPIEEIARLLVGNENILRQAQDDGDAGTPDCAIVDTGHAREIDLALQLPEQELGPIASHELWGETLDAVAKLVEAHDTTLVFVNTRRLVERVSHQLSMRLGEEAVVAHHGSLSRATRLDAEEKLKAGQVKVCVATASLELGIDIGDVDLACQIGSPSLHRRAAATGGPLRALRGREAQGPAVPLDARRVGRVHCAIKGRPPKQSGCALHPALAGGRAGPADSGSLRPGRVGRRRPLRLGAEGLSYRELPRRSSTRPSKRCRKVMLPGWGAAGPTCTATA